MRGFMALTRRNIALYFKDFSAVFFFPKIAADRISKGYLIMSLP